LALESARGTLERVVCDVDTENYLVALDAIGHVMVHGTSPLSL
jgi:hypothetical protein